jgi:hypothetical protein
MPLMVLNTENADFTEFFWINLRESAKNPPNQRFIGPARVIVRKQTIMCYALLLIPKGKQRNTSTLMSG